MGARRQRRLHLHHEHVAEVVVLVVASDACPAVRLGARRTASGLVAVALDLAGLGPSTVAQTWASGEQFAGGDAPRAVPAGVGELPAVPGVGLVAEGVARAAHRGRSLVVATGRLRVMVCCRSPRSPSRSVLDVTRDRHLQLGRLVAERRRSTELRRVAGRCRSRCGPRPPAPVVCGARQVLGRGTARRRGRRRLPPSGSAASRRTRRRCRPLPPRSRCRSSGRSGDHDRGVARLWEQSSTGGDPAGSHAASLREMPGPGD